MNDIGPYYDQLAPRYDADRFGNSYGRFLHLQETRALAHMLQGCPPEHTLDLACGTGRLLQFADTGLDLSPAMLDEARRKFPDKTLVHGDATRLPFADASFDAVFSLHFFMHLGREQTGAILAEVHRVLRPGGCFVFDFPSLRRRRLTRGHHDANWHGSQALRPGDWPGEVRGWASEGYRGLLFLPMHRLPAALRPALRPLDTLLCRSPWKEWASYLLLRLRKN